MDASEFRPQEGSEGVEATESMEVRALDSATFEPRSFVEQAGDIKQSEAIQSNLETVMANIPEDTVAGLRPQMVEGTFEKSPGKDDGGDDITPINLPGIQSTAEGEIGFKYYPKESGSIEIPLPGEEISATPINLPREADLASSAGGVAGSGGEQVGITPINLPREADLASSSGGVAGSGAEQVDITPINLPREANVVSDAEQSGNNVASGEIKGPGGDGVASGAVKGPGGDGVAEGTVRGSGGGDPAGGVGWKGSGDIPISLRSNVAGSGEPESASGRQQEMPREGPYAPAQAENTGEGSYVTPINLPLPNPGNIAMDGGVKLSSKEPGAVEIPLTGTGAESMVKNEIGWKTGEGKGPAGAVEIPLPGIAGEGGLTEEAAIEQVVFRTEAAIEEMSESFNLQYLMLQNKIVHENRQLSMPSNIMKTDHDTAKNSINNIR